MLGILYHGTKIEGNSILRNRKLSEFRSEPFHRGEKCSEFRSMEKNLKQNLETPFRSMSRKKTCRLFCLLEQDFFVKLIFFMPFSYIPSLGIDSSVNFGMPRNKHFLPRNNGSHSESVMWNFFGMKFRCQPYIRQSIILNRSAAFLY
jgi:hypothetical protein